jgi:AbrB family looped-hinge helix DNA binding protein
MEVGMSISTNAVALLRDPRMTEVVVSRKGHTTIPAELRAKYRIQEGSRLEVIDAGNGIMFRPKKSFLDLAGSGAEKARVTEMKRLLDKQREESIQNC